MNGVEKIKKRGSYFVVLWFNLMEVQIVKWGGQKSCMGLTLHLTKSKFYNNYSMLAKEKP